MGGGSSQPVSTAVPPPPQPVIKYDPATSAAEQALAGAKKDSFASSVETEEEKQAKAKLGTTQPAQPAQTRRAPKTGASMLPSSGGNLSSAAVLTG